MTNRAARAIFCSTCVFASALCAEAAVQTTWTGGAANSLWIDPANWSAGVPGVDDTAILRNVATPINLGGDKDVRSVWVSGLAELTGGSISPGSVSVADFNASAVLRANVLVKSDTINFGGGLVSIDGPVKGADYGITHNGPLVIHSVLDVNRPMIERNTFTLTEGGTLPRVGVIDVWSGLFEITNPGAGRSNRINSAARIDHTSPLTGQFTLNGSVLSSIREDVSEVRSSKGVLEVEVRRGDGGEVRLHAGRVETSPGALLKVRTDSNTYFSADAVPTQFGGTSGVETPVLPFIIRQNYESFPDSIALMTYDRTPAGTSEVGFRPLTSGEFASGFSGATANTNVLVGSNVGANAGQAVNSLSLSQETHLTLAGDLTVQSGVIQHRTGIVTLPTASISGPGRIVSDQPIHWIGTAFQFDPVRIDIQTPIVAPSLVVSDGAIRLSGQNPLPGGVRVMEGAQLRLASQQAIGNVPIVLTGGRISFEGDQTYDSGLTIEEGEITTNGARFRGGGIGVEAGKIVTFNGPLNGIGSFAVQSGRLRFNGGGSFTGAIGGELSRGVIELNGTFTTETSFPFVRLSGNGRLYGNATIPLEFGRGRLSPGAPGEVGAMHIRALDHTFGGDSIIEKVLEIEVDGLASDLLTVDVLSQILNAPFALDVNVLSAPSLGAVLKIVQVNATTGTLLPFTGLVEGTTFISDGASFRISYLGGDGNDVTLTVVPEPGSLAALGFLGGMCRRSRRV